MAILTGDIKLLASERLTDAADGGGRMTGQEIVDGVDNNLFDDISELDRVYGRISLRKTYLAVLTDNTDKYFGSHIIIDDPPDDPHVAVTLFSTESWSDERNDARDYIERFLARAGRYPGYLYGTQFAGQRAITLLQRQDVAPPEIGQVLCLIEDEGLAGEQEQYARITTVESLIRTFYDPDLRVDYQRVQVTCEISDALRYEFHGGEATQRDQPTGITSTIRTTVVANAAQYYGIAKLTEQGEVGDLSAQVGTIFTQLVPSAQVEQPLVDATAAPTATPLIAAGNANTTLVSSVTGSTLHLNSPVVPKSVHVTGTQSLVDNGKGTLTGSSYSASIDYRTGIIVFSGSGTWTVTATPAGDVSGAAFTQRIEIDINTRSLTYVPQLVPLPALGTVTVDYMVFGQWYRLRDVGDGHLSGVNGTEGVGTINFETGSLVVTLTALPDIGSTMIISWNTPIHYDMRISDPTIPPPQWVIITESPGIKGDTVSIGWTAGGQPKTVADNGSGQLSGDGTGRVLYTIDRIALVPNTLPDPATQVTITYESVSPQVYGIAGGSPAIFTVPNAPIRPGSVTVEWSVQRQTQRSNRTLTKRAQDDGAGGWKDESGNAIAGSTINYTTGEGTLQTTVSYSYIKSSGSVLKGTWSYETIAAQENYQGPLSVKYHLAGDTFGSQSDAGSPPMVLDFTPSRVHSVVPGSLRFKIGNTLYVDRAGTIVSDPSPTTGAGTAVGTIDYLSGEATLTTYPAAVNSVTLVSLLTWRDYHAVDGLDFRTGGAPVRPASLSLTATAQDGEQLTATSDADGAITGDHVTGTIDWESGVVHVEFGDTAGEVWTPKWSVS